jgi:hypothetical protein
LGNGQLKSEPLESYPRQAGLLYGFRHDPQVGPALPKTYPVTKDGKVWHQ